MPLLISDILEVLRARGVEPDDGFEDTEFPEIGQVAEGETIYATSVEEIFREDDDDAKGVGPGFGDDRLNDWWHEIEAVIEAALSGRPSERPRPSRRDPPEPHCAWYGPIHFFGHSWGIYIRESCILSTAFEIARLFVDWRAVPSPFSRRYAIARQLLRSAFYVFYLHEQFHHKVESLGFRLLIATGTDRYRPYKAKVYRPSYLTADCLEESLANAESCRRLGEPRYTKRHDKAILSALRTFLKTSFPWQPPGYAQATRFLTDPLYRNGLYKIQSQMLDGALSPTTPPKDWVIAPNVITSLMDISADIYVILPVGKRPIFRPTSIDPGFTVSSRELVGALTRHHGYQLVAGGKGSHVKLTKPGAPNVHIPGNRAVVSPGVVKQALYAIGGYPLSRLPDLLQGKLRAQV